MPVPEPGLYGLAWTLLRLLTFSLSLSTAASAQIFQPSKNGEVWRVGDVITIEYQTTKPNYTIALWQEALPRRGEAAMGPVLVRR